MGGGVLLTDLIRTRLLLPFVPKLRRRDLLVLVYPVDFVCFLLFPKQVIIDLRDIHGRTSRANREISFTNQPISTHSRVPQYTTSQQRTRLMVSYITRIVDTTGDWGSKKWESRKREGGRVEKTSIQQPENATGTIRLERRRAHTVGIHRFNTVSYSNSRPSSVSRINLSSSFEKEIRGSLSNSEGSWGKFDGGGGAPSGLGDAIGADWWVDKDSKGDLVEKLRSFENIC